MADSRDDDLAAGAAVVIKDEGLVETLASIQTALVQGRAAQAGEPEAYLECLSGVIGRLLSFKEAMVEKYFSPTVIVETSSLDRDIDELEAGRCRLIADLRGAGSQELADAAVAWYARDHSSGALEWIQWAIIGTDVLGDSHWEGIRLIGMHEDELKYCIAAYLMAKDNDRSDVMRDCESRLRKASERCIRTDDRIDTVTVGIQFPEPEMETVEVPSFSSLSRR